MALEWFSREALFSHSTVKIFKLAVFAFIFKTDFTKRVFIRSQSNGLEVMGFFCMPLPLTCVSVPLSLEAYINT